MHLLLPTPESMSPVLKGVPMNNRWGDDDDRKMPNSYCPSTQPHYLCTDASAPLKSAKHPSHNHCNLSWHCREYIWRQQFSISLTIGVKWLRVHCHSRVDEWERARNYAATSWNLIIQASTRKIFSAMLISMLRCFICYLRLWSDFSKLITIPK